MTHWQYVALCRIFHLPWLGVRTHQLESAFLLPSLVQGLPELWYLGLDLGRHEFLDRVADNLFPRDAEKPAYAQTRVAEFAGVICDEDRCGRIINDGAKEELELSRAVLHQPVATVSCRSHIIFLRSPLDPRKLQLEETYPASGREPPVTIEYYAINVGVL